MQAVLVRAESLSTTLCVKMGLLTLNKYKSKRCFVSQVLETCMKNCGNKFHGEVGKFRFLNELIKVVSPKVMS